ncbi:MAG: outer membrane beta-barrel protein [Bacteriovorax sp.]|nr:outer membrane beta-barrel protein [Bacteriovorax sp.]
MKLTKENRRSTFMSLFLASALIAGIHTGSVIAQDDMLDEANDSLSGDDSLQMDDINLEGKLSPSERLRQRREKLEERNKIMVEKKIEDIRVKQEIALTNKLQDAFGKSLNNLNEDKVQVVQAAPVAPQPIVVAAPVPVIETKIIEVKEEKLPEVKKSKVIPYLGAQSIKGDKVDFESKLNIGVNLETMVLPQLSVGLGVGYTSLDITDVANTYLPSGSVLPVNYIGRKMSSSKVTIEANSKYFLIEESRIKPFVGAALSYNRSNLKYDDNGNGYSYNNNGGNFGNEGYSSTAMGATAKLGAEIDFNATVGLNIDLSYTKTLSSGISSNADTTNSNPDQGRLQNITKSMEDSDITAIQAGLVVKF